MAFIIPSSLEAPKEEPIQYVSGYSEEDEFRINQEKLLIDKRDLSIEPVTLEEFKDVIAPWFRINRTKEFVLHPEKIKKVRVPREPKVKVPREPKVKKLTKAQIQNKLQGLIMKLAIRQEFTEEETAFYKEQTGG